VLNQAPHHEEVLGCGGIAPRILNLGTRWEWVVSFTPWSLYPRGKNLRYQFDRTQSWYGQWEGKKVPGNDGNRTSVVQPVAQSLFWPSYHDFFRELHMNFKYWK